MHPHGIGWSPEGWIKGGNEMFFIPPKKGDKTDNTYLARLELICIMWFTVEYALRLAGAPEKWNFLKGLEISE